MSYQIKCTPRYYDTHINSPRAHLMSTDVIEGELNPYDNTIPGYSYGDTIAEYETEAEAQAIIDKLDDGPCYLSHGEYASPDYEIIEDYLDGADCIMGTYEGQIAEEDVPEDILDKLDSSGVDYGNAYDDSYDTYSNFIDNEDGSKRYRINYTVSTVALQINAGDLGNVVWDHEVYTIEDI